MTAAGGRDRDTLFSSSESISRNECVLVSSESTRVKYVFRRPDVGVTRVLCLMNLLFSRLPCAGHADILINRVIENQKNVSF